MSSYSIANYVSDAHRTAPEQSRFVVFDEERHAAYGIVTECSELLLGIIKAITTGRPIDVKNFVEELGDIMWYVALWLHAHSMSLEDALGAETSHEWVNLTAIPDTGDEEEDSGNMMLQISMILSVYSGNLVDLLKKRDAYGKQFSVQDCYSSVIVPIIQMVRSLCGECKVNFSDMLDINIKKLRARYPEKFDTEKAINRDLAAEDRELSKIPSTT